jgi:ParB family chromosome partitioning protein
MSKDFNLAPIAVGTREVVRAAALPGRSDIYMIPLDKIKIREGFNDVREVDPEYPEHLAMLAESIKSQGFNQDKPVVGFAGADGFMYLTDGHSRYRASILANLTGAQIEALPFKVEAKGTNDEDRIFGLITNNNGRNLTPMGEALVVKQLLGRGVTEKEISRRLPGFTSTKIDRLLTLLSADSEIRDMVQAGTVSATLAINVVKSEGVNAAEILKEGAAVAAVAGKTKVTERSLNLTSKPKKQKEDPTEKTAKAEGRYDINFARLQWLAYSGHRIQTFWDGEERESFAVVTIDGNRIGAGKTFEKAIDNAMQLDKAKETF